jgi:hypothetical protein
LNIKQLEIPEFYTASSFKIKSLIVNAQVEVSDELFFSGKDVQSSLQNSHLNLRVTIKKIGTGNTTSTILNARDFNSFTGVTHEDFTILYKDLDLTSYFNSTSFTELDTIEVEVVPIVKTSKVTIVYEQFRTKYSINLAAVSNTKSLSVAQNTFRYYVQDDGLALTFDVQGPFLNNSEVKVYYNIYAYNESSSLSPVFSSDQEIPDINLLSDLLEYTE